LVDGETYTDVDAGVVFAVTEVRKHSLDAVIITPYLPPFPIILFSVSGIGFSSGLGSVTPPPKSGFDVDLHVYTLDGKHVGQRYDNIWYDMEIENAYTSRNLPGGGPEWIAIPHDLGAYAVVDATPARRWVEEIGIDPENVIITAQIQVIRYDENGIRHESKPATIEVRLDEPTPFAIPAKIDVTPSVLNLKSKGRLTVRVELPENYSVKDVDKDSIAIVGVDNERLERPIRAESVRIVINEGIRVLLVKFNRSELKPLLKPGERRLIIAGRFTDWLPFEGSETVRVVPGVRAEILDLTAQAFSPNADGSKDTTIISYRLVNTFWDQMDVTIEIYASDGELVRRLFSGWENASKKGVFHVHPWDGRDDTGNFVEDGIYTVRVEAVDVGGNSAESRTEVIVDTMPPESSVNKLAQYWHNAPNLRVTAEASDELSGVESVELWYRYSSDNSLWTPWRPYDADNEKPWSWRFVAENDGYYEFASFASDEAGNSDRPKLVLKGRLDGGLAGEATIRWYWVNGVEGRIEDEELYLTWVEIVGENMYGYHDEQYFMEMYLCVYGVEVQIGIEWDYGDGEIWGSILFNQPVKRKGITVENVSGEIWGEYWIEELEWWSALAPLGGRIEGTVKAEVFLPFEVDACAAVGKPPSKVRKTEVENVTLKPQYEWLWFGDSVSFDRPFSSIRYTKDFGTPELTEVYYSRAFLKTIGAQPTWTKLWSENTWTMIASFLEPSWSYWGYFEGVWKRVYIYSAWVPEAYLGHRLRWVLHWKDTAGFYRGCAYFYLSGYMEHKFSSRLDLSGISLDELDRISVELDLEMPMDVRGSCVSVRIRNTPPEALPIRISVTNLTTGESYEATVTRVYREWAGFDWEEEFDPYGRIKFVVSDNLGNRFTRIFDVFGYVDPLELKYQDGRLVFVEAEIQNVGFPLKIKLGDFEQVVEVRPDYYDSKQQLFKTSYRLAVFSKPDENPEIDERKVGLVAFAFEELPRELEVYNLTTFREVTLKSIRVMVR
jgi:hypothetical protein